MSMTCPKCGVRIISTKILESHLKKTHNTTIQEVQKENPMAEETAKQEETVETNGAEEAVQTPGEGTQGVVPEAVPEKPVSKSKSQVKREEALRSKREKTEVVEEKDEAPVEPIVAAAPEFATIESADGRKLQVSIGNQNWEGRIITVPKELEGEIRRILKDGNFFIQN